MKRIKSACLLQTIYFRNKNDIARAVAERAMREEVAHYKTQLERNRTAYKIEEEAVQPDGSVIVKIRKQYNNHNVWDYMDDRNTTQRIPPVNGILFVFKPRTTALQA